jgi:pyrroloquinoline quinone (PQQ) biosynthesis protein C
MYRESCLKEDIFKFIEEHDCYSHPLFAYLNDCNLTLDQAKYFLRNYDVHAGLLRRLLLKAASIMPEAAVGFVLENVRNEYGNGNYRKNHRDQLRDLAYKVGVDPANFCNAPISTGIKEFLKKVVNYYCPTRENTPKNLFKPAIVAGAITATELMAIKEFEFMQKAFAKLGQANHIWFDHIAIEASHTDESLMLANHFAKEFNGKSSVLYGLSGVLDTNMFLYDGLLQVLKIAQNSNIHVRA